MKLSQLRRTHRDYAVKTWRKYEDLFNGGEQFHARIGEYLPQHDVEPDRVYHIRKQSAHYVNYCAPIGNFFASLLFSSPPRIEFEPKADPVYEAFKEDCDGNGTDLDCFMRARFVEALKKGAAYHRVEFPTMPTAEERSTLSLGDYLSATRPVLSPIQREAITHWSRDSRGRFEWVVVHDRQEGLPYFEAEGLIVTETWTKYTRSGEITRWEISYSANEPPEPDREIPGVVIGIDPTGGIPIVETALPAELHLMAHLAEPQLEHFRQACALAWSMARTCYAMPAFFLKNKKSPPAMGTGYYIMLGIEERVEWPAPPAAPFATIETRLSALKDEMHRVATQMSRGVENNAASVGRSGESKQADDRATENVTKAYAEPVKYAIEETHELIAAARGEDLKITVGGMDTYDLTDAGALIGNATSAQTLGIPSKEYKVQVLTRAALSQLPDADDTVKSKITDEIRTGVESEPEVDPLTGMPPGAPAVQPKKPAFKKPAA